MIMTTSKSVPLGMILTQILMQNLIGDRSNNHTCRTIGMRPHPSSLANSVSVVGGQILRDNQVVIQGILPTFVTGILRWTTLKTIGVDYFSLQIKQLLSCQIKIVNCAED
jgi:hypothetical protein